MDGMACAENKILLLKTHSKKKHMYVLLTSFRVKVSGFVEVNGEVVPEVVPHPPLSEGGSARPRLRGLVYPDQPDQINHQGYQGVREGHARIVRHDGVWEVVVVAGVEEPGCEEVAAKGDGQDTHEGQYCCCLPATVHWNLTNVV